MRVVAWNMGRRDHASAWRYLLDELSPDIALLQETVPPPIADEAGDFVSARAYEHHPWGSAVFASNGRVRELPLPDEHRGWYIAAEVEIPGESPFVAVSVHARILNGYVRSNIDHAFDSLEPLLDGQSFVVGGDFNLSRLYDEANKTTHHGEFFDLIESRGFFNCHRKFHPGEERTFWGANAPTAYQDDHLYVSTDWADRVKRCEVVPRVGCEELSDHSALLLELS